MYFHSHPFVKTTVGIEQRIHTMDQMGIYIITYQIGRAFDSIKDMSKI